MTDYRTPGGHVEETEVGSGPVDGHRSSAVARVREKVSVRVPPLSVSLAVFLVDGQTGRVPGDLPDVSLQGITAEPTRRSDGYQLFLDVDLPEPPTSTVVTVNGGDRYRDMTREVFVTRRDDLVVPAEVEVYPPSNPTVPVRLFPDSATVLRGFIRDTDENRLSEARLRVTDLDFDCSTETDANGRFVLYFCDAPTDDVDAELRHESLDDPVALTLPVIEGEETVQTLVVDVDAGTVSIRDGVI